MQRLRWQWHLQARQAEGVHILYVCYMVYGNLHTFTHMRAVPSVYKIEVDGMDRNIKLG